MGLLNIGFGNLVNEDRIVAIVQSDSAPAKRLIARGKEAGSLIDATQGRRTKSVIAMSDGIYVLSALTPDTLFHRSGGTTKENSS